MSELVDNSTCHDYYLSLIVNNYMDFTAKIAFRGKANVEQVSYSCKGEQGVEYQIPGSSITKEVMFILNCDITSPSEAIMVNEHFAKRTAEIIKISEQREAQKPKTVGKVDTAPSGYNRGKQQLGLSLAYGGWADDFRQDQYNNASMHQVIDDLEDDGVGVPIILGKDERFVAHILRFGNPPVMGFDPETELDDALEELEISRISSDYIAATLVDNYNNYYEQFFGLVGGDYNEYHETLIAVINILSEQLEDYKFLKPAVYALKKYADEFMKQVMGT